MADRPAGFFQDTEMPAAGWWEALWPDPAMSPVFIVDRGTRDRPLLALSGHPTAAANIRCRE